MFQAYCPKHTKKRERGHSESDTDSPRKEGAVAPKKELTKQEKANLRVKRCVNVSKILLGKYGAVISQIKS